jgi:hypothetical protein
VPGLPAEMLRRHCFCSIAEPYTEEELLGQASPHRSYLPRNIEVWELHQSYRSLFSTKGLQRRPLNYIIRHIVDLVYKPYPRPSR